MDINYLKLKANDTYGNTSKYKSPIHFHYNSMCCNHLENSHQLGMSFLYRYRSLSRYCIIKIAFNIFICIFHHIFFSLINDYRCLYTYGFLYIQCPISGKGHILLRTGCFFKSSPVIYVHL